MISQQEFEAILVDDSKTITGNIVWVEDLDHSPAREFKAKIQSDAGYPLFIVGRYSGVAGTLSYALIHSGTGRIYALDLGRASQSGRLTRGCNPQASLEGRAP